jgi:hypothetical protein
MSKICKGNAAVSEKRIQPGGYFCNQKLDEIGMLNADILRALDAITGANASREEIFRLVARIYDQVHKSDKALQELKLIYK